MELFDTHAPLEPSPGRYAPLLAANFSLSSLICALPTLYFSSRTLLFDRASRTNFAAFHEFFALSTFSLANHLHAGNSDSMARSNLLLISYYSRETCFFLRCEVEFCGSQKALGSERYSGALLSPSLQFCREDYSNFAFYKRLSRVSSRSMAVKSVPGIVVARRTLKNIKTNREDYIHAMDATVAHFPLTYKKK